MTTDSSITTFCSLNKTTHVALFLPTYSWFSTNQLHHTPSDTALLGHPTTRPLQHLNFSRLTHARKMSTEVSSALSNLLKALESQHSRSRDRRISVDLRPVWSIQRAIGHPGLHRDPDKTSWALVLHSWNPSIWETEASLVYDVSYRTAKTMQRDPISKINKLIN